MGWLILHIVGYMAIIYIVGNVCMDTVEERKANNKRALMGRIAKLELECGIGLKYGLDWVLAQPVKRVHAERVCVICGKGSEFGSYAYYGSTASRQKDSLAQRLCPYHYQQVFKENNFV